eukprot:gene30572-34701_t
MLSFNHLAIAAALALLPSIAQAQTVEVPRFAETPTIEVVGYAEEVRVPDEINVRFTATSKADTADAALKDLGQKTKRLIDLVKVAGVPDDATNSNGPTTEVLYKRFYEPDGREI